MMADTQKLLATFEFRGVWFEVTELVEDKQLCISTARLNSLFSPEIWIEVADPGDLDCDHDGKVIVFPHGAPIEIL